MSSMHAQRHPFISFLRGLAIFIMLWGHCIQYCCGGQFDFFLDGAFKTIYAFHMPLFMLISGYLFFFSEQKRDLVNLIEYRSKSLLYPILTCSVVNLLLTSGVVVALKLGRGWTSLLGGTPVYSLWFLWSTLACSIAVALAIKVSAGNMLRGGALLVAGMGVVALFPCWDMNIYMYPYFVVGYLMGKHEERLKRSANVIGTVCSLGFLLMLCFFRKEHYIYTSGLKGGSSYADSLLIDLFRWTIGFFGSISVAWLAALYYKVADRRRAHVVILEALGKDSLAVYALSVSLLSFWLPKVADRVLGVLPWLDWNGCIWAYDFIVTPLISIAYSVFLLWIIKRLRDYGLYKLIFGR